MLVEYTELISLSVFTPTGKRVGMVSNLIFDMENNSIYELLLTNTNPSLIENGLDIAVPFRWVNNVGEVIILNFFPGRIKLKGDPPKAKIQRTKKKWTHAFGRQAWE